MKKVFTLAALMGALTLFAAHKNTSGTRLTGKAASDVWAGAQTIWIKQDNIIPAYVEFRKGVEPAEAEFLSLLTKRFRLPSTYSFQLTGSETDQLGWQHKRYQLLVNNIPVHNGVFLLHTEAGKVKKYNGYIFKNIGVGTTAGVSESDALAAALDAVHATTYKWELMEENQYLKQETGNANASYFPKGQLEIIQAGDKKGNDFRLAWKFDIYAHQPVSRDFVYVDAQTGKVITTLPLLQHIDETGVGITVYRGQRDIVGDNTGTSYRLRETGRGQGIRTLNMQTGTSHNAAVDFTDTDNFWNNTNAALDQYAADAHYGGEMTYDFYQSMGRNSIDNNGFRLTLYVHYDQNYVNAFWDGQSMNFGDGSGAYDPLTSLDITGHEISHGLDQYTANLDYQDESGALNESFSDIFGTAVEWYADSTVGNWLIGEDIGVSLRSMQNPNSKGDPDTYGGTYWYTGTADNGGVHTNSNVQNHWYYRLSEGGSGTNDLGDAYNVIGIGRHKATQIAWRTMVYYLTSSADYEDARFYSIQSANDLFGGCSPEATAVTNAWYAVGVGDPFTFGVHPEFTPNPSSGCIVPLTVSFANTTSNGSSYSWDFGDGATSTAQNPTHVYTSYGNYTVKLVADGGACGIDSTTSSPISINSSNPCVVVMPHSGTYQQQTACTGTVYDDGGVSGNYSDNSNSTVTISPYGAAKVTLNFTQFNMEQDYDYVYVYDGPNTSSPVIGSYTGTTLPTAITSSGPSVTVRQNSDNNTNAAGFTMLWSCIAPTTAPTANFKADVTESCSGLIHFTDLTTGGVTSWQWDFGDGTSSTDQHPTHIYVTSGTYSVTLTSTNSFGPSTVTKTNYIIVTKPAGPAVASINGCHPDSFVLTASTVNTVNWYDNNGNLAGSGNPFTTPYLNSNTTYAAEEVVPQAVYNVGPADNTIGTGSNFTNTSRTLRFRVFKNCRLESVFVYAQGDGYRTIIQRDSSGAFIASRNVFCPNGGSRITLNLDMVPGTYQLGTGDTVNLYRNDAGATYPYTDGNGIISIYGNNANNAATRYYFFYDWEVREQDCLSQRTPVTVTVGSTLIQFSTSSTDAAPGQANGSASVTNISGGASPYTVSWSNGQTGNTASNLTAGSYTATITDNSGCQQTTTVQVNQSVGIQEISGLFNCSVYPNPANDAVTVSSNAALTAISITDIIGQKVLEVSNGSANVYTLHTANLSSGVYYLQIKSGEKQLTKQLVISR